MASCRVMWTLSALAFVSCVLISTVASNDNGDNPTGVPKTIDELKRKLASIWSPKRTEKLLDEYENKGDKILDRTIGELNEMCKPSLDKCSRDVLNFIFDQTWHYYSSNHLALYYYGDYCGNKLKDYCFENINVVVENWLKNITLEDKELVSSFRDSLLNAGVIDKAHLVDKKLYDEKQQANKEADKVAEETEARMSNTFDGMTARREYRKIAYEQALRRVQAPRREINKLINKAFLEEVCRRDPSGVSLAEQELFLYKFAHAAERYRDIYLFILNVSGKDESGSKLKEGVVSDAFKFGRIANRFLDYGVGAEFFLELQKQLKKVYAQSDERMWWRFFNKQTERQLREFQVEREQTKRWAVTNSIRSVNPFGRYNVCN